MNKSMLLFTIESKQLQAEHRTSEEKEQIKWIYL